MGCNDGADERNGRALRPCNGIDAWAFRWLHDGQLMVAPHSSCYGSEA